MESGDRDMYRQFQDWCLRTYGDSGKTKTVTRSKYQRIAEVLQGGSGSGSGSGGGEKGKFQFWVRSKGFRLGNGTREATKMGQVVVYVPVKTGTVSALRARGSVSVCLPVRLSLIVCPIDPHYLSGCLLLSVCLPGCPLRSV